MCVITKLLDTNANHNSGAAGTPTNIDVIHHEITWYEYKSQRVVVLGCSSAWCHSSRNYLIRMQITTIHLWCVFRTQLTPHSGVNWPLWFWMLILSVKITREEGLFFSVSSMQSQRIRTNRPRLPSPQRSPLSMLRKRTTAPASHEPQKNLISPWARRQCMAHTQYMRISRKI